MFSIIITDYQTISETFSYIMDVVYRKFKIDCNIVVVDNSNQHDALHYMTAKKISYSESSYKEKKLYELLIGDIKAYIIDADSNGGFSVGNNLGANFAMEKLQSEYLLFSNSDIDIPDEFDFDYYLKKLSESSNIGIVGPEVITPNGTIQSPRKKLSFFVQMVLKPLDIFWLSGRLKKHTSDVLTTNTAQEVDWISGCFMFVRSDAFLLANGFDENIFLYCEEIILSERFRRNGFKTYYLPNYGIIHKHEYSKFSLKMEKYLRNSWEYYFFNYGSIRKWKLWTASCVYNIILNVFILKKRILK